MDEKTAAKLRAPFPPEQIGQLPRGGTKLDYVGHADVTSRLLEADPGWDWQPLASDEHGLPLLDTDERGHPVGLWIKLTVGGVTRLGYGSCPSSQGDAVKVLIGDALRNAAMRFGVALDLWAKGDRADPTAENATASGGQAARRGPRQQGTGEDWRNSPPVNRPRSDANGHTPAHDSWAEDAEAKAPALTSKAAAKALYEETVAKAKAGEITNEQKNHICDLITAQVEHLTAQAAAVTTATVPDGDPWQAKVEEITSKQEADDAIAELDQAHADGHIDDQRHKALRAAMVTKGGSRQGALV